MRDSEQRLRSALRALVVPEERDAEERAWRLLSAARTEQPLLEARRGRARRRGLQVAVALGLIALIVSPAGASVRHWVADRVNPGVERAKPALSALPGSGALLVQSQEGPWVVHPDGSKRLLGDFSEASWSPHGLFVVAMRSHELAAVEPDGATRWTITRPGLPRLARWNGPDGYRIAYLEGRRCPCQLRVVNGNGEDDRLLAHNVPLKAPAWKSGPAHLIAFLAAADGVVRVMNSDTRTVAFQTPPGAGPVSLQWTSGLLLVARADTLQLYSSGGRLIWKWTAPRGTLISSATARGSNRIAAVLDVGHTSKVLLLGRDRSPRPLFTGPGRFATPEWSPDGGWLLLPWPRADQWLFINPASATPRLHAVANVASQFSPGSQQPGRFPTVAGWCCAP